MTFHEELQAIARLQRELGYLQDTLIDRERAEKDATNRDPDNTLYSATRYRQQWNGVKRAFDALSRD